MGLVLREIGLGYVASHFSICSNAILLVDDIRTDMGWCYGWMDYIQDGWTICIVGPVEFLQEDAEEEL
jgi:hypothetical protein